MRLVQGIHKRRLKNGSLRPAKSSPIIYSLAVAVEGRHPMGQRQLNRLLKLWVVEAGLDPSWAAPADETTMGALDAHLTTYLVPEVASFR